MQLHPRILAAIAQEITREYLAHAAYLAHGTAADALGLDTLAAWCDAAADEEVAHARRLLAYARARNAAPAVTYPAASDVPAPGKRPTAWLTALLDLERAVSEALQAIVDLARELRDEATARVVGELLAEQVSAEKELTTMLLAYGRLEQTPGAIDLYESEA